MAAHPSSITQAEIVPDLSDLEVRARLTESAVEGFLSITEKWDINADKAAALLGGIPRATYYKLKTNPGTRSQDELTRISYLIGIYRALHSLLPAEFADRWVRRPNDEELFKGQPPLDYMLREGIPGLRQVRNLLDGYQTGY